MVAVVEAGAGVCAFCEGCCFREENKPCFLVANPLISTEGAGTSVGPFGNSNLERSNGLTSVGGFTAFVKPDPKEGQDAGIFIGLLVLVSSAPPFL